jgi:hypothetical protein
MNGPALCAFRKAVGYLWRTALRRRSQGNHLPWRRMRRFLARWFPPARVCHPYPLLRLGVVTQGKSRMRQSRLSGSVEGCALKAQGIQSPEMEAAAKPSSQPRTKSCVVSGNGHCEA